MRWDESSTAVLNHHRQVSVNKPNLLMRFFPAPRPWLHTLAGLSGSAQPRRLISTGEYPFGRPAIRWIPRARQVREMGKLLRHILAEQRWCDARVCECVCLLDFRCSKAAVPVGNGYIGFISWHWREKNTRFLNSALIHWACCKRES